MDRHFEIVGHYRPQSAAPLPILGIILYTDAHAHIKKVLRDEDYWRALDEISGARWPILSIRALPGHHHLPNHGGDRGTFGYLIGVWSEPAENRDLLEAFALPTSEKLPLLLVIARDGDDLLKVTVRLSDNTEADAYARLRQVFEHVAIALQHIAPENESNAAGVFNAVRYALRELGETERLGGGYRLLKEIRDWF